MMTARGEQEEPTDRLDTLYGTFRTALLAGIAVVVPVLITIYIMTIAVGVLSQIVEPFVRVLRGIGIPGSDSTLFAQFLAFLLLAILTILIGLGAIFQRGRRAIGYFDVLVERLPGIGGIYKSFRKMSDVLLESGTENFQSVVLVEFPQYDVYTLGFETTETPAQIEAAAGENDMLTLFLPLAPNPVMGGHLAHVPRELVTKVDMSIEEGLRTVVTTGVAVSGSEAAGLTQEEMVELSMIDTGRTRRRNHDRDSER
jgi:uncharacterized membrane protein